MSDTTYVVTRPDSKVPIMATDSRPTLRRWLEAHSGEDLRVFAGQPGKTAVRLHRGTLEPLESDQQIGQE